MATDLFFEIIFLLVAVYLVAHALADALVKLQDLDHIAQDDAELFEALLGVNRFQQFLLLQGVGDEVRRQHIGQPRRRAQHLDGFDLLGRKAGVESM